MVVSTPDGYQGFVCAFLHNLSLFHHDDLFGIPYGCRATDMKASDDRAIWRLEVTAATSGSNYKASFEVPVFQTPESNPNFKLADDAMAGYEAPQDSEEFLRRAGVIRTTTPNGDGQRFIFPATRNLGMTIGHTAFTAVWSGVVYLMWHLGAPMVLTIIFGLFNVLMLGVMLDLWLYRSSIDVTRSFVVVNSGWLGLGSHRELPVSDIEKFDFSQSMQSNQRVFFNLYVVIGAGKKIKFAKNVAGNWTAKAVIKAIQEAMGGKPV